MITDWNITEENSNLTFDKDVRILDDFVPKNICKELQNYAFNQIGCGYTNLSEGEEKSKHWGASIVGYPHGYDNNLEDNKDHHILAKEEWESTRKQCPAINDFWKFLKKHSPIKRYLPSFPNRGLINVSTGGHGDICHLDNYNDDIHVFTHILYLNDDLTIDDGGQTEFYSNDRSEIVGVISPKFGRLVILDGRIPHAGKAPWPHYTGRRITVGFQCVLVDKTGHNIVRNNYVN